MLRHLQMPKHLLILKSENYFVLSIITDKTILKAFRFNPPQRINY